MAQSPELRLRQRLTTQFTPAMQLGQTVLSLGPLALLDHVQDYVEQNPLLVIEEPPNPPTMTYVSSTGEPLTDLADTPTLAVHLRQQLSLMQLPAEVARLALWLSDNLDERGFLRISRPEIAVETRARLGDVARAIDALQSCEPVGIGAESLEDSLALQLQHKGHSAETARLICRNAQPLLSGDWRGVEDSLASLSPDFEDLARQLRSLTSDPAAAFGSGDPRPLVPDLRVSAGPNGAPTVAPVEDWMPRLSIDEAMLARLQQQGPSRAYAETQARAGRDLLMALAYRRQTMVRLGAALIDAQMAFFRGKSTAPAPLTRALIAERLGLHPSTIGRAVRGRALEHEGRVLPLGWFFPAGLSGSTGEVSAEEIRIRIARLIAEEDPQKTLSDNQITSVLQEDGVDISRRTVAKYREGLKIPSSHLRRRVASPRRTTRTRTS